MYESFYRLRAKPFQLNPDPSFFYGSKGHNRAMSYLEYGLHQGEGFIVITGEVGAGKTTLVHSLFKKLEGQNLIAAQLVSTQLDADDTLRMVAAAFGVPHEDASKAVLLKKLESFLLSTFKQGRRALLVVDEAQNLTARALEELRMLSNFQAGEKSLLQSFLLGQPEFRYTMQSEDMQQLRQRVIASYHLGPMDARETKAYIEHRLNTVSWKNDPSFRDDAFALIHEYSGGIPRRINTLCDRLLLMGYLEELHLIDAGAVRDVTSELQLESTLPPAELTHANPGRDARVGVPLAEGALEADGGIAKLEQRMSQIEMSVISVLKLMRKLLSLADLRRLRGNGQADSAGAETE